MTHSPKTDPGTEEYARLPHVAKGAMINFSGTISRAMLVYVYTFVLARMLSADELGQYFLIFTIINLLGAAAIVGLDMGVVRYVSLYAGQRNYNLAKKSLQTALLIIIEFFLVFAVGLFLAAPRVTGIFMNGNAGAITPLRLFAIAIPLMVIARMFNSTTQGMHQMQYQVYSRDIGEQIFKLALTLGAFGLGLGLIGVIWASVAAVAMAAALSLYFAWKVLLRYAKAGSDAAPDAGQIRPARALWRYSYPLALANVVVAVQLQTDMLLLGYLGTTSDVGYYGVALKLALVGAKILSAFAIVMTPIIADLWNRKMTDDLQTLFRVITRWVVILNLPVLLVLVVFANGIMKIFGAGFTAGSVALILLAIGQMVNAGTGTAGVMIIMSGMSKLELLNVVVTLIVDAGLCFLLIPRYGLVGAAIASMSSIMVVNIMRLVEVWHFMHMHPYEKSFLNPLIAAAAGVAVSSLAGYLVVGTGTLVRVGMLAALLIVVYIAVMAALGFDENDKDLYRMIRNRLRPAT
ncbi:MAG: flippase [Actinobacteria bacterium]|nr:flippase [Actinomycetota bacterium]